MRKTYRVLADIIAIVVVIQAMTMVFAVAGLFHWIDADGGAIDAAVIESWDEDPPTFQGAIGVPIHGMVGMFLIPLIALVMLIVSFFAKVAGGVKWAAVIVVLVIVQVTAGILASDAPWIGLIHGLNAFALFSVSIVAARAAHPQSQTAMAATP